ncbi:MAG: glycerol-3-phosphate dehydrogenase [bacterium]|nr:glycerol-3-phosphate dehydrogenase [bacterium]
MQPMYDIAIIGGGINGCGIARDATGRGLKTLLVEMNDLASGTSSRSTKLIHGGLRYLEHYEFALVRKSLIEREVLCKIAPHIIEPLRFIFPHHQQMRPIWLMRLGLFLYDHIGGRKVLPSSKALDLTRNEAGEALQNSFTTGFEYSDCRVDDARLVILNAMDAFERGADILVGTKLMSAQRDDRHWSLQLRDKENGEQHVLKARTLINAAGPWVDEVVANRLQIRSNSVVRQVKGSHILVPRLFSHNRAYIFQNPDQRIIFAIPYEGEFTLIGTTDVDFTGDPGDVEISSDETSYLCEAASEYFKEIVAPANVVWSFAGVRPLFGNEKTSASKLTRDYVLDRHGEQGEPALLSIFGGKITTYRKLAEKVLAKLEDQLPANVGKPWTSNYPLPGGDFEICEFDRLVEKLMLLCPHITLPQANRLMRAYGTRAFRIFAPHKKYLAVGEDFGGGLTQIEVEHLIEHEWATNAEDILWRRSKLGLTLSRQQQKHLDQWLQEYQKVREI